MSEAVKKQYFTEQEYLVFENSSEQKHEYHKRKDSRQGEVFLMVGVTQHHDAIKMNLTYLLAEIRKCCRVNSSEFKLKITHSQGVSYRYPDLWLQCHKGKLTESHQATYGENPTLIIEVLSKSTRKTDLTIKVDEYKEALKENLGEYLIVDSESYFAELRGWQGGKFVKKAVYSLNDRIFLQSINLELVVKDIYETIKL